MSFSSDLHDSPSLSSQACTGRVISDNLIHILQYVTLSIATVPSRRQTTTTSASSYSQQKQSYPNNAPATLLCLALLAICVSFDSHTSFVLPQPSFHFSVMLRSPRWTEAVWQVLRRNGHLLSWCRSRPPPSHDRFWPCVQHQTSLSRINCLRYTQRLDRLGHRSPPRKTMLQWQTAKKLLRKVHKASLLSHRRLSRSFASDLRLLTLRRAQRCYPEQLSRTLQKMRLWRVSRGYTHLAPPSTVQNLFGCTCLRD